MRILVTGASGYVGSRLIPELLTRGHAVVGSYTTERPADFPWCETVEWRQMDVLDLRAVVDAVSGVDAVAYLIHGLDDDDFRATDREAAENMRDAIDRAGVSRLVYLSGIVPDVEREDLSEHLVSRLEVEETLAGSSAATLTLRAAIVLGSGSTSFEVVRQISERLPLVQVIPTWMKDTMVQPIAVTDAVYLLAQALEQTEVTGHLDIAGPDRLTYPQLLEVYADVAGLTRVQLPVPAVPVDVLGAVAGALTDVPTPTVAALTASLRHDMVASQDARTVLGDPDRPTMAVRDAITRALAPFDAARDGAAQGGDALAPSAGDPVWSR